MHICSLPSSKPALLISGILCLDEFQAQNLSTILFHQYVKKDHTPFLSRGMSWLLLGDGSHQGLEYRQEEKRRRVIQELLSWLMNSAVSAREETGPGHLLLQLWQMQYEPIKSLALMGSDRYAGHFPIGWGIWQQFRYLCEGFVPAFQKPWVY